MIPVAKETKNSAVLTDPIVCRGLFPWPIKVEVTTGPHPPPQMASRKPPEKANFLTCLIF